MSVSIEEILKQGLLKLSHSEDINQLEQLRVEYLGKKGFFTDKMKALASLDPDLRRSVGQVINQAKDQFQTDLEQKRIVLNQQVLIERLISERIDVSLPGRGQALGRLHPVTTTLRRISELFRSVGFAVVEA